MTAAGADEMSRNPDRWGAPARDPTDGTVYRGVAYVR
jgi:hypothetical protein